MKLLFVVNDLGFFLSHRRPIAMEAVRLGHEVHVAAPAAPHLHDQLPGVAVHAIKLCRGSAGPLSEVGALLDLISLMNRLKPDAVHLVTSKPVIVGGIAARIAGVPAMVAAISGMGYVFTSNSMKAKVMRFAVTRLYGLALRHRNVRVIFQNDDDRNLMVNLRMIRQQDAALIRGSGVSLDEFAYLPEPEGTLNVVFAARLLADKGIREFMQSARTIKARGRQVKFTIVGSPDPGNPSAINSGTLALWQVEGVAEFLGHRTNIAEQFAAANIVVLPSYREGLPKTLVEAAACGRAVVTTDVPGCRDAIIPGETGLLVPAKDSDALTEAIETLLADEATRKAMGAAGRLLAERNFAVETIVAAHLGIYHELLAQGTG